MTKAEVLRIVKRVERLIAPLKIDLLHLTPEEALRLENARRALSTITGSPYP